MSNFAEVVKVEKTRALIRMPRLGEIWLPRPMLKQYGVSASMLKVGARFDCFPSK